MGDCVKMGYQVFATETLADALAKQNVPCMATTTKDACDILMRKEADFLLSIPSRRTHDQSYETGDHYSLRRAAVDYSIPLMTELENARMLVRASSQPCVSGQESCRLRQTGCGVVRCIAEII